MTLPLARKAQMGVIAKRPIANAAWRSAQAPSNEYHRPYWERLRKLDYDFLKSGAQEGVSIALRFTLAVPGVHTAIVGTKNPKRWHENAQLLNAGPFAERQFEAIRARWQAVAGSDWVGQT